MTWRRQGQEGGLSTCPPAPEEQGEPSGLIARTACGRQDGELTTWVPQRGSTGRPRNKALGEVREQRNGFSSLPAMVQRCQEQPGAMP